MMDLSIVIPAYNEEKRLGFTLSRTHEFLLRRPWLTEIIVVDDGSQDGTVGVVEAFVSPWRDPADTRVHLRCVENLVNRGKGYSVRHGVSVAGGRVVGFMDADYKTHIEGLDRAMELLAGDWHGVVGDRTLAGTRIQNQRRAYRELGSRLFRGLLRASMGLADYPDTQCGFKFFQAAVARDLFGSQRVNGFMFDVEILLLAGRRGYRLARMPVLWSDDPDSRFKPVRGSVRNMIELLQIRWWHRHSCARRRAGGKRC